MADAVAPWLVAGVLLVAIALVFAAAVVVLVRHHRGPVDEHQAAEELADHLAYIRALPAIRTEDQAATHRALATQPTEVFHPIREEESHATQAEIAG